MYDTRDFDPDPYRGVFFEFANEHSAPYLGSNFTFHKMLLQFRHYQPIAPRTFGRTLLATRVGYGRLSAENAKLVAIHTRRREPATSDLGWVESRASIGGT